MLQFSCSPWPSHDQRSSFLLLHVTVAGMFRLAAMISGGWAAGLTREKRAGSRRLLTACSALLAAGRFAFQSCPAVAVAACDEAPAAEPALLSLHLPVSCCLSISCRPLSSAAVPPPPPGLLSTAALLPKSLSPPAVQPPDASLHSAAAAACKTGMRMRRPALAAASPAAASRWCGVAVLCSRPCHRQEGVHSQRPAMAGLWRRPEGQSQRREALAETAATGGPTKQGDTAILLGLRPELRAQRH